MKGGLIAAIAATFSWSLLYLLPNLIGEYSTFDLAVVSYAFAGLGSLGVLARFRRQLTTLTLGDWLTVGLLGFLGYIGYFFLITSAVIAAGPVIPPVMLGCVPIVLAIAGNLHSQAIPWRSIAVPLLLCALGIMMVNASSFERADGQASQPVAMVLAGILISLLAIGFWTAFGLLNERALSSRPGMDPLFWSALLILMCSIEMAAFLPVGLYLKLSSFVSHGGALKGTSAVLFCGLVQGLGATLGGAWAWSIATRSIPLALGGQLIASETLYATTFGLLIQHRWPSPLEALGTATLFLGVTVAIGQFYRADQRRRQGSS